MKKKGFGKSQASIKEAKKFLLAFRDCGIKNNGDKAKFEEFLKTNLDKLDESLLEALPLVFRDLTANKLLHEREYFANIFDDFAHLINNFSLNNKSLNKELSIVAFKLVVKILNQQDFPKDWAMTQMNLGSAYLERIRGERADNLETAITCYQEALKVFTFTACSEDWAMTQMNLGNAYSERIRGERADNLETAITCYQEALKVYTFTAFPQDWARTQMNLGSAYQSRIRDEWAENLETAITCYQEALKIFTIDTFPSDWALTQMNLGNTYAQRIKGERADNLENAITCYQEALKVDTFIAFLSDWALTQMNLGNAYSDRIRGERAENLETAITFYQKALRVYTFTAFPHDWAKTQMNLGGAYSQRIKGERANNLETAITCYQEALKIFTIDTFPSDWALTQMNLGNTYAQRIRGERADNLETAITCYQDALKVFTIDNFPQDWARTQGNLALTLKERASLTDNHQDLEHAIELYRQALTVSAPGSSYFINGQYYLGNALARRYEINKNPDNLQQSLAAYQIALNYLSPEHYDRQQFWQAIPATQAILGSRLVRDGNWQEGLKLLINSLNQLKTGDNSLVYANALHQTGYAYEVLSDWENARLYYRDALRLYDHLKDLAGIAKSREGLGGVFVSQGYLEKGMNELAQARELYQQLNQIEKSDRVEHLYQVAQRAQEKQKEVMV